MPQYAISDIHGHLKTFQHLLKRIDFQKTDELFLLGDYIDRGPDSKGVIDYIESLKADGNQVYCLRGNHEQLALDAPNDFQARQVWLRNGGEETCASFDTWDRMPPEYEAWMNQLPLYLETEGYLFVHAGIDTNKLNPLQDERSMLWARRWTADLNQDWLNGRIVVHGHTPTQYQKIQTSVFDLDYLPVINIDAGCFATHLPGLGNLCALELGSHRLVFQENIG